MIVWIDLETTGLDIRCQPIEVALVFTDDKLNELDSYESIIALDEFALCQKTAVEMHTNSGLWEKVQNEDPKINTEFVDLEMEHLLHPYFLHLGKPFIVGGSSVHFDTEFFASYFPRTNKMLHYRHLDVSSLKIIWSLATGVSTEDLPPKKSETKHRAMDDILDSIKAARLYMNEIDKVWIYD